MKPQTVECILSLWPLHCHWVRVVVDNWIYDVTLDYPNMMSDRAEMQQVTVV